MDRRFQVFVSSTYKDLKEERQEVMYALLQMKCIPSGMELFPAADDEKWKQIKKVIDDCDYYIVIIGRRYGTIGNDGKSYTQLEYEYALSINKPTLGFIQENIKKLAKNNLKETKKAKQKLQEFRNLVMGRSYQLWKNKDQLGSVVKSSIHNLMDTKIANGWVRGDIVQNLIGEKERLEYDLELANKSLIDHTISCVHCGEKLEYINTDSFASRILACKDCGRKTEVKVLNGRIFTFPL